MLTSVTTFFGVAPLGYGIGGREPFLEHVALTFGWGLVFTAGEVLLPPLLGAATANVVVTLVLLWSIPVEGHIIARAIDQHWFLGVAIALAVFIFQLLLHGLIDPMVAA